MRDIYLTKSGRGHPLLLLHGWGFDHRIWSPILPRLEKNHTVYRVDLPGFGQTAHMLFEDFSVRLFQLLPQKLALLGWSMGGLIATQFALEYTSRISHLINISSSPCFVAQTNWPGIASQTLDAFYTRLKTEPEKIHHDFIRLQLPQHIEQNKLLPLHYNEQGLKKGLDILKTWDFRQTLYCLNLPIAYVFGRLDSIVPTKTMAAMQSAYPNFQYELIRKAGHAPFLSHPEIFLDFIEQFIEGT